MYQWALLWRAATGHPNVSGGQRDTARPPENSCIPTLRCAISLDSPWALRGNGVLRSTCSEEPPRRDGDIWWPHMTSPACSPKSPFPVGAIAQPARPFPSLCHARNQLVGCRELLAWKRPQGHPTLDSHSCPACAHIPQAPRV